MSENGGSIDLYDGGSGVDTLRLELTGTEWANAGVKADVAAFLDNPHHAFLWQSTGLLTHDFENLVLVVDGQVVDPNPPVPVNHAPVAANDMPLDDVVRHFPNNTATGNVINDAPGVDIDPDGDSLAIVGVAAGNHDGELSGNVGTVVEGTYGLLTIGADGTWHYTLDNTDPDTLALPWETTVHDTFSYTVSDGHGGFDTASLSVAVVVFSEGHVPPGTD
jgi:VCBS repeat-containing protein